MRKYDEERNGKRQCMYADTYFLFLLANIFLKRHLEIILEKLLQVKNQNPFLNLQKTSKALFKLS